MTQAKQRLLYETDYVQWIETTVEHLRKGHYDETDWDNLIDESKIGHEVSDAA